MVESIDLRRVSGCLLSRQKRPATRGRRLSLAVRKHRPLQKEHADGSTTDRPEPQLATAPLRESHVTAQEMAQEFDRLDPVHKDTLKRAVHDGQPYDQIARETGVSEGTVKSRISRARDRLNGAQPEMQARTIPAASRENGASVDHVLKFLRAEKVKIEQATTALEQLRPRLVS